MAYCIIIRGPLGIGKTSVAKHLAKMLGGKYISIDSLLAKAQLDRVNKKLGCIPAENFIKATETIIPEIKILLKKNETIVFDGNFYHKKQISHLKNSLDCRFYIFTLTAPLAVCIKRDSRRKNPYGRTAAKAVYDLVSMLDSGIKIDAEDKAPEDIMKEVLAFLSGQVKK